VFPAATPVMTATSEGGGRCAQARLNATVARMVVPVQAQIPDNDQACPSQAEHIGPVPDGLTGPGLLNVGRSILPESFHR
jgi:hypothetical protein